MEILEFELNIEKKQKYKISTVILILILMSIIVPHGTADFVVGNIEGIHPQDWWQISLVLYDKNDLVMNVQLLRPLNWIEKMDAEIEGYVHLVLPEKGINDRFLVQDIIPCPNNVFFDDGNIVTGLFRSYGPTLKLSFVDSDETLECTYGHRFFSIDQNEWISAEDLQIGERLKTDDEIIVLKSVDYISDVQEVFNLEIAKDNSYFVTDNDILTHNTCLEQYIVDNNMMDSVFPPKNDRTKLYLHKNQGRLVITSAIFEEVKKARSLSSEKLAEMLEEHGIGLLRDIDSIHDAIRFDELYGIKLKTDPMDHRILAELLHRNQVIKTGLHTGDFDLAFKALHQAIPPDQVSLYFFNPKYETEIRSGIIRFRNRVRDELPWVKVEDIFIGYIPKDPPFRSWP